MKKSFFLNGISVFVLLFTMIMSGCEDAPNNNNHIPRIANPKVKAEIKSSGVLLSWLPVIDVGGYEVWRSGGGQIAAKNLTSNGRSAVQNMDGIFEFYDLVSFTNELTSYTEYTYTVIAVPLSPSKDIGKWEEPITTGFIPEPGSQIAQPDAVSLQIDFENKSVIITVSPPIDGNIPDKYQVMFGMIEDDNLKITRTISSDKLSFTVYGVENNSPGSDAYNVYMMLKDPKKSFYVTVVATLGDDYYFKPADPSRVTRKYDSLFGINASLSVGAFNVSSNAVYDPEDSDTIKYFWTSIDLSKINLQPGVTYTLKRLKVLDNGNTMPSGTTFYKDNNNDTPINNNLADIFSSTVDIFGNLLLSVTTVYDRQLANEEFKYRYCIEGSKEGSSTTDYIESNSINIDFKNYLKDNISIKIAGKVTEGSNVYFTVTPGYSGKKGLLQEDDKIVLYWLLGGNECYKTDPFIADNNISFSKEALEMKPTTSERLPSLPASFPVNPSSGQTGHKYIYVQAYLERNGDKINLDSKNWTTGGGLFISIPNNNGPFLYRLNY
jgi:hypothetical protein